jgi:uridine kinase
MSSEPSVSAATVERVLSLCLAAPPTLGTGRLLCIDGPAGSGKTTLADALVAGSRGLVPTVHLVQMDDLYEGWGGLGDVASRVRDDIVEPLAHGRPGRYRRWDWAAGAWAESHTVDPVSLLVIEGVGAGALEYRDRIGTLVWVEAPALVRITRGLVRDGEAMRPEWESWVESEAAHFARQQTRARADLVVDGSGRIMPEPSP